MKNLSSLDVYRIPHPISKAWGDKHNGFFILASNVDGMSMVVAASKGEGWEHVSISRSDRVPDWWEMCYIKNLFFHDHEYVMQLHVPSKDHINLSETCLHLWRPIKGPKIPIPPQFMV